jgi:tripartite-type tricarboxylate transporter receptor subunit TctC
MCSVNNNVMTLNPALYAKLPYDPATQLKPVILMYIVRDALVTSNDFPAKSVAELKDYAVNKKGPINFGTLGPGSVPDLFIAWLNKEWGTSMKPIAYKSGAAVSVALMSNEVQVTRFGLGNYEGLIREGRIRFIAGGKERYKSFPDVPSGKETGLDGFPFQSFIGIAVPAGTPDAIVNRLHDAFAKIVQQPKYEDFLEKHGLGLVASTRGEFEEFLERERKAAKELVKPIKTSAH